MLQVAPIAGVVFNNLLCSKLPLLHQEPRKQAVAVPGNSTLASPTPLFVE